MLVQSIFDEQRASGDLSPPSLADRILGLKPGESLTVDRLEMDRVAAEYRWLGRAVGIRGAMLFGDLHRVRGCEVELLVTERAYRITRPLTTA